MGAAATRDTRSEFRELERVAPPPPPWRRAVLPRVGGPSARPLPELRYLPFGHEIAAELDGAIGHALWRAIRQVRDWVDAGEHARAALFPDVLPAERGALWDEARAEAPELAGALTVLESVARSPQELDVEVLAGACSTVMEWGVRNRVAEVAIHFAEGAARVVPDSADASRLAARLCRLGGEWSRSETWYLRAIGTARSSRDIIPYVRGYLGYGTWFYEQGQFRPAWQMYHKAGNAAQRTGYDWLASQAWHDLFVMCTEADEPVLALRYARRALAAYPVHHQRVPAFAYDVGYSLVRQGLERTALPILKGVVERLQDDEGAAVAWSTLARAAAAVSDTAVAAWAENEAIKRTSTETPYAPAVFVNLAYAAYVANRLQVASAYVHQGLELAKCRGDVHVERAGNALLLKLDQIPPPPDKAPLSPEFEDETRWLAADVVNLVARWRGTTWRRKRQTGRAAVGVV